MRIGIRAAMVAALAATGLATAALAGIAEDDDRDGVTNVYDNCRLVKNAPPLHCDTDQDGYGNACDGDFDQNKLVTGGDFSNRFVPNFKAGKPGPSGLFCAGTIPCDL